MKNIGELVRVFQDYPGDNPDIENEIGVVVDWYDDLVRIYKVLIHGEILEFYADEVQRLVPLDAPSRKLLSTLNPGAVHNKNKLNNKSYRST